MKITVDTSHDSHDDIRKVIKMLQHLVGDSQEIFTNQPSQEAGASPVANIFGDVSAFSDTKTASETAQETQETQKDEASESTDDLFAELFSEEELKKMEPVKEPEDEDEEEELSSKSKSKDKKYGIEFY
ncbi:hypothetical protein HYY71_07230 [Candidatus Woesearchaeota archaeon]|nr:hypothetical protein [Candidatus Woesearchaeota archaeon]